MIAVGCVALIIYSAYYMCVCVYMLLHKANLAQWWEIVVDLSDRNSAQSHCCYPQSLDGIWAGFAMWVNKIIIF